MGPEWSQMVRLCTVPILSICSVHKRTIWDQSGPIGRLGRCRADSQYLLSTQTYHLGPFRTHWASGAVPCRFSVSAQYANVPFGTIQDPLGVWDGAAPDAQWVLN